MGDTMKKEDVLFGGAKFGPEKFAPNLTNLPIALAGRVEGEVPTPKWGEARALLAPFIKDKAKYSEVYWKIGFIKKDLVFRIKSQKTGIRGITGHTETDLLLLRNCRKAGDAPVASEEGEAEGEEGGGAPSPVTPPPPPKGTQVVALPTYILWDGSRASTLIQQQGFVAELTGGRVSVKVALSLPSGLSSRALEECKRLATATLTAKAAAVAAAIEGMERSMVASRGAEDRLAAIATATAREVEGIADLAAIQREIEEACKGFLRTDEQFRALNTELKVKAAITLVGKSLSAALATARLVVSAGADVTAYLSIASAAVGIAGVVSDLLATEPELRQTLIKSVRDFEESSELELGTFAAKFEEEMQDKPGTLFNKAKGLLAAGSRTAEMTAQALADRARQAVAAKLGPTLAAKVPSPDLPEAARRRYVAEVGGLLKKLDDQHEELAKAMAACRNSGVTKAVQIWQQLTPLKKAYQASRASVFECLEFASTMKAKLDDLGIKTSDANTVEKVRAMVTAIRTKKFADAIPGGVEVASGLNTLKGIVTTIKDFAELVA